MAHDREHTTAAPRPHPGGTDSPLSAAMVGRDRKLMTIVASAIRHREVILAHQPVVQARNPGQVAFYEAFARSQS